MATELSGEDVQQCGNRAIGRGCTAAWRQSYRERMYSSVATELSGEDVQLNSRSE